MFRNIVVFLGSLLLMLMNEVHCMECDYRFLNKRAKAYAIAVVRGEEIEEKSVIDDLHCMDVKFDTFLNENSFLDILQSLNLSQKAKEFFDKGMGIYKKLEDPIEKGRFLLLLGGIISEIIQNVDPVSIASGAID